MKQNLLIVLNAVLLVAVAVLFVLHFTVSGEKNDSPATAEGSTSVSPISGEKLLPVAYVNVDSLLVNYTLAKKINEQLMTKSTSSENRLRKDMETFQKEAMDYQQKMQTNAFLNKERELAAQEALMKKQQELEALEMRLTQNLQEEQIKVHDQLRDSINNFMKDYNKDKKYQLIFSNSASSVILHGENAYNITSEVLDLLNKRYENTAK